MALVFKLKPFSLPNEQRPMMPQSAISLASKAASNFAKDFNYKTLLTGEDPRGFRLSTLDHSEQIVVIAEGDSELSAHFERNGCVVKYYKGEWFVGDEPTCAEFVEALHPLAKFASTVIQTAQAQRSAQELFIQPSLSP